MVVLGPSISDIKGQWRKQRILSKWSFHIKFACMWQAFGEFNKFQIKRLRLWDSVYYMTVVESFITVETELW